MAAALTLRLGARSENAEPEHKGVAHRLAALGAGSWRSRGKPERAHERDRGRRAGGSNLDHYAGACRMRVHVRRPTRYQLDRTAARRLDDASVSASGAPSRD